MEYEFMVEVFKCCIDENCCSCPLYDFEIEHCKKQIQQHALSFIIRQQAEIDHLREATKKVKSDLKYYLDTNEENGVVWIPKFTINNLLKEMTEEKK